MRNLLETDIPMVVSATLTKMICFNQRGIKTCYFAGTKVNVDVETNIAFIDSTTYVQISPDEFTILAN